MPKKIQELDNHIEGMNKKERVGLRLMLVQRVRRHEQGQPQPQPRMGLLENLATTIFLAMMAALLFSPTLAQLRPVAAQPSATAQAMVATSTLLPPTASPTHAPTQTALPTATASQTARPSPSPSQPAPTATRTALPPTATHTAPTAPPMPTFTDTAAPPAPTDPPPTATDAPPPTETPAPTATATQVLVEPTLPGP